ncbi:hypothetical protein ISN44_As07g009480 [Arabidopsis suecica]|uniref:No apical meristem-associated C-terminal domain-containing protein n=1 Tax=Arabidopsis suecica TaxID=45249 RepID=A0A8T2BYY9_ARASU|nr:hypothetical protein ISN44_As07g009480 [Arabidopsis suecica]
MPYMMPPNFGMQYPYNHRYMPYGYPPVPGNTNVSPNMNYPNSQPINEPTGFSSGSTDTPQFCTQMSFENAGGDTPILQPTQQSAKKKASDTFWGKIAKYVNESTDNRKIFTATKCQSHFRDINKKICTFVGCYNTATRERRSGLSDDDYITNALGLYEAKEGCVFAYVDEWKLVRHQPKYMLGSNESGSSGSKRKSGSDDVESTFQSFVRPAGREATKKRARASSSKSSTTRKSKHAIEEELSNLASIHENLQQNRKNTISAILELSASQKEVARSKNMELWLQLHKKSRDDAEQEAYMMLTNALFNC